MLISYVFTFMSFFSFFETSLHEKAQGRQVAACCLSSAHGFIGGGEWGPTLGSFANLKNE